MPEDIQKRNKRQQKWKDENRDRINLLFTKGIKEKVQEAADISGVSKSQWIEAAINERLEREQ
ncbi:uncharacterized protein (DUF1778 family) [Moryella indoligenes]|uniref:Uncharacterized protein (DUF1778 family) n=1 Tax=Moryella indoligenes TaxID=371674 RepID=A0AAE3VBT6_9FIRM|nr:hypothetical protein [Moryella indoligenes]MDQ0153421.1 uncharacterized protein (DUF1778 family) [Moryella indoligenes]